MTLKEIPPTTYHINDIRSLNNSNFNISSSRYNEGDRSQGNNPSGSAERPIVASVQSRLEQAVNGVDSPIHAMATELGDIEALKKSGVNMTHMSNIFSDNLSEKTLKTILNLQSERAQT